MRAAICAPSQLLATYLDGSPPPLPFAEIRTRLATMESFHHTTAAATSYRAGEARTSPPTWQGQSPSATPGRSPHTAMGPYGPRPATSGRPRPENDGGASQSAGQVLAASLAARDQGATAEGGGLPWEEETGEAVSAQVRARHDAAMAAGDGLPRAAREDSGPLSPSAVDARVRSILSKGSHSSLPSVNASSMTREEVDERVQEILSRHGGGQGGSASREAAGSGKAKRES